MARIKNDSLEALRECKYDKCDLGYISDNVYLSIVATNKCNKNCFYCINSQTDDSWELDVDKALENIRKVVDKYGVKEAVILGGEPTLHPRLFDLIEGLKTIGLRRFGITTNGIKLREKGYTEKLAASGVNWINISCDHINRFEEIKQTYKRIKNTNPDCKVRINTNVYKNNNDYIYDLLCFTELFQNCCDEMRVSNIILKDEFSVNPSNNPETKTRILSDGDYELLFDQLISYYENNRGLTAIVNDKALGFVKYTLIPTKSPIIVNHNINSDVSKQICENDIENRKIHTFKCLVSGDISLSWNKNSIIRL